MYLYASKQINIGVLLFECGCGEGGPWGALLKCAWVCVSFLVLISFVLCLYSLLVMFVLFDFICMTPLENEMGHL